ncbi:MAG: hypothetical protein AB7N65_11345 [Vicinamibacterales bacterium]
MTRIRAIQMYGVAIAVGAVAYALLGPSLGVGSSLFILGLLLAPAAVVFRFWPDAPGDTAMEIMRRQ